MYLSWYQIARNSIHSIKGFNNLVIGYMAYYRRPYRYRRRTTTVRRGRRYPTRKRYVRKRGLNRKTKVRIPNYIMPDYSLVKLRDRQTITFSGFSEVNGKLVATAFVRGNDMFNAFMETVPTQITRPTGFFEWTAMYDQFIVHQSALKITPIAYQTGASETTEHFPFRLVVVPFDSQTFSLNSIDPTELAYSRSRVYNGNSIPVVNESGSILSNADAGNTSIRGVFNRMSTKKMLGYKDLADVAALRGTRIAGPSRTWSWVVYVETLIPLTAYPDDYSMVLEAQIYYKAQFLARNQSMSDSQTASA